MRLIAQRPMVFGKKVTEPWWENFLNYHVGYDFQTGPWTDASWTNWPSDDAKIRKRLRQAGGFLIQTHYGLVIEFDNEADATAFLLRWS